MHYFLRSTIRLQKRFLREVLGIVSTQSHTVGQAIDVPLVFLDEGIKGRDLTRQAALDQLKIILPLR